MSRYFFDLQNGHRRLDLVGRDCAGKEDAIAKAKTIARQIEGYEASPANRTIAVVDTKAAQVGRVVIPATGDELSGPR